MAFPFRELPEELQGEIVTHLPIESAISLLGTSKDIRQRHLTEQIKGNQLREKLARKALAKARSFHPAGGYWRNLRLASSRLTKLLGPFFPKDKARAIVNADLMTEWILTYAGMNGLLLESQGKEVVEADPLLVDLVPDHYKIGEMFDPEVYTHYLLIEESDHYDSAPFMETRMQLDYVSFYLDEVNQYMARHGNFRLLGAPY